MREQDTLGVEFANRSMILRAVHCKNKKILSLWAIAKGETVGETQGEGKNRRF